MDNLVIGSLFGGLGDHLFLSPIPYVYKKNFPDKKVFLSARSKFRQWEIYNIIWESHPYLDGIIESPISSNLIKNYKTDSLEDKFAIEILYEQLDLKYDASDLVPIIYNKHFLSIDNYVIYKGRVGLDLNYLSHVGAMGFYDICKIIDNYISFNPLIINPSSAIKKKYKNVEFYNTRSLRDYSCLVNVLSKLITFPSGGATLAVALNTKADIYFGHGFNKSYLHSENNNIQINKRNIKNICLSFIFRVRNKLRILFSN